MPTKTDYFATRESAYKSNISIGGLQVL